MGARILTEAIEHGHSNLQEKRTLIYGAGDAGITLLREIRNNARLAFNVRGFIDDRSEKRAILISGLPVLGNGERVSELVMRHRIEIILIAIPSATGVQMTRILDSVMPQTWSVRRFLGSVKSSRVAAS